MDELEQEINSIAEEMDHSAIAADIIEGRSPESVIIFSATVILALINDAGRMLSEGKDPTVLLEGAASFAGIIMHQVPEEFYAEALDALQYLDNAVNMTSEFYE